MKMNVYTLSTIRCYNWINCLLLAHLMCESRAMKEEGNQPKLCSITRSTGKTGFHRDVYTRISLPSHIFETASNSLEIVLKETLPSGMYVDFFETKSKEEFGGLKIYSDQDMDVERPEYLSSSHSILVYAQLQRQGREFFADLTLPVHLRYHRPKGNTQFEEVSLQMPELFVKISDTDAVLDTKNTESLRCHSSSSQMCLWRRQSCEDFTGDLHFSVPVGDKSDIGVVVTFTLTITIGATIFLSYSMISMDSKKKHQKNT